MIRRSISQIFTSNSPSEQRKEYDEMIARSQMNRPGQPSHSSPLNQQQTRTLTPAQPILNVPLYTQPTYFPPRNQIEAMPPHIPVPLARMEELWRAQGGASAGLVLDPSRRHPVFFTDRLKKAPYGVSSGGGAWSSPVAEGYIFNDGEMAKREEGPRL
ncbi:hypothetical protein BGZ60DRAFT_428742 [Tricladium varicosporioides]|nr:hypothetical protein BGZ60DRAFT_428742 [Hymenoscyphus varicosporioides]